LLNKRAIGNNSLPITIVKNRQDACSTTTQYFACGVGTRAPTIVKNRQDACSTTTQYFACGVGTRARTIVKNRQDACSTTTQYFACGVGTRARPEKLINNTARCQQPTTRKASRHCTADVRRRYKAHLSVGSRASPVTGSIGLRTKHNRLSDRQSKLSSFPRS